MKRLVLALLTSAALALPAHAEPYISMGPGTVSCAKFLQDYKQNPELLGNMAFSWAQGYMSGANALMVGALHTGWYELNGRPDKDQEAFLLNYCDQHPLEHYQDGVHALMLTLPPHAN